MTVFLDPPETDRIVAQARSLGASLAGVAPMEPVLACPSGRAHHALEHLPREGSLLVLALSHPATEPRLDHWGGSRGTEGNRILHAISERLCTWLADDLSVEARPLPYQVRQGGTYLKDAAVLAGLGVIGRNNLVITPELGPRIRLSAIWMDAGTAPVDESLTSPCETCPAPCLSVCPQGAFQDGAFSRPACMVQMGRDEADAGPGTDFVAYCRECEMACPVGVSGSRSAPESL